jgi:carbamoyltransferase
MKGAAAEPCACFVGNEIELLVVSNCMRCKDKQDPALKIDYKDAFEPD